LIKKVEVNPHTSEMTHVTGKWIMAQTNIGPTQLQNRVTPSSVHDPENPTPHARSPTICPLWSVKGTRGASLPLRENVGRWQPPSSGKSKAWWTTTHQRNNHPIISLYIQGEWTEKGKHQYTPRIKYNITIDILSKVPHRNILELHKSP
jgi:hypothetical protein